MHLAPRAVSVTGPQNGPCSRERPTTAPCWPGMLTGSTGKRVFLAADFHKGRILLDAVMFPGHRRLDEAVAHAGCELENKIFICPCSVSMENI